MAQAPKTSADAPPSFEALGIAPAVCAALAARGIAAPRGWQRRALRGVGAPWPDTLAEAEAHGGRHVLLSAVGAHCALRAPCATAARVVVVLVEARNTAKMVQAFDRLRLPDLGIYLMNEAVVAPPKINSEAAVVIVSAPTTPQLWPADFLKSCCALVSIDVQLFGRDSIAELVNFLRLHSENFYAFLLTSCPPHEVHETVRYALNRNRRRYCSANRAAPLFTYCLALNNSDREQLCLRLCEMEGSRRTLVMTHNKEVREVKTLLSARFGPHATSSQLPPPRGRLFTIQRGSTLNEQRGIVRDFLTSASSLMISVDAYRGVDLCDVDLIVQFHPPQKSMPEEEWIDYLTLLTSTGDATRPTRIVTLLCPDDFTLTTNFMRRVGGEGPVLNVAPTHRQFAHVVRFPNIVAEEKLRHSSPGSSGGTSPRGGRRGPRRSHRGGQGRRRRAAAAALTASEAPVVKSAADTAKQVGKRT